MISYISIILVHLKNSIVFNFQFYYDPVKNQLRFCKEEKVTMELDKIYAVGPQRKDARDVPEHIFADVVLMHRFSNGSQPVLYQLKTEFISADIESLKYGVDHFTTGSFKFVGSVKLIDKKKKVIYLNDNSTVTYRHLIVASGIKHDVIGNSEFTTALNSSRCFDGAKDTCYLCFFRQNCAEKITKYCTAGRYDSAIFKKY